MLLDNQLNCKNSDLSMVQLCLLFNKLLKYTDQSSGEILPDFSLGIPPSFLNLSVDLINSFGFFSHIDKNVQNLSFILPVFLTNQCVVSSKVLLACYLLDHLKCALSSCVLIFSRPCNHHQTKNCFSFSLFFCV